MTIDIDRIRKLAEAATPGEWGPMTDANSTDPWKPNRKYMEAADGLTIGSVHNTEPICRVFGYMHPVAINARYIAAVDPQTVLAILAENQRLRDALQELVVCKDLRSQLFAMSDKHMQMLAPDDDPTPASNELLVQIDEVRAEYLRRKAPAWSAARAALSGEAP